MFYWIKILDFFFHFPSKFIQKFVFFDSFWTIWFREYKIIAKIFYLIQMFVIFSWLQSSTNVYKLGISIIAWTENHISIQKYRIGKSNNWTVNNVFLGLCIQPFDQSWKGTIFNVALWLVNKIEIKCISFLPWKPIAFRLHSYFK